MGSIEYQPPAPDALVVDELLAPVRGAQCREDVLPVASTGASFWLWAVRVGATPPLTDLGVRVGVRHDHRLDVDPLARAARELGAAGVLCVDPLALNVPWGQAPACALSAASSVGGKGLSLLSARLSIPWHALWLKEYRRSRSCPPSSPSDQ